MFMKLIADMDGLKVDGKELKKGDAFEVSDEQAVAMISGGYARGFKSPKQSKEAPAKEIKKAPGKAKQEQKEEKQK